MSRCHGNMTKYKHAFKICFVDLQELSFLIGMKHAWSDAHKLTSFW